MKKKNNIISALMRHYDIVWLLVTILVAVGVVGLTQMNKQEFPEVTIRQGVVVGVYPGATPKEVEEQLTKPLENYLFSFQEVDKKKTYSYSQDGMVYVFVELRQNVTDKDAVWSKIKHGLKDFKMTLPTGVLAIVVNDDFGNTSSLLITMKSKDKNYKELAQYMDQLSNRLRQIDAVGNIKVFGKQNEEIAVYVDQEKMATYGISPQTLMLNLYLQGMITTGGTISNYDMKVPIHIESPYKTEQEVADQIVYMDPSGNNIRLKDVARIERTYPKPTNFIKADGMPALVISVEMQSGNNIVKFGKAVEKVLRDYQKTLPESVSLYRITDLPKVVGDSVQSFMRDLLLAIVVVIFVMLMLFPFRSAMVAAVGIPITIAITWGFMYACGMELNTVTLASLMVVLGMIVDNSIVVIDGYIDHVEHGMSRWNSAVKSAQEYFKPLLIATLAMGLAFFPFLLTVNGTMKDFILLFPFSFGFALLVSLLIAMFVTPFLEYRFIKRPNPLQKQNKITVFQNRFFAMLQGGYDKILEKCFNHPYITLSVGAITIVLAVVLFKFSPVQMMPDAERNCFAVEIYLPKGSSIEETTAVSDSLQNVLLKDKRIEAVTSFIGSGSPRFMAFYAPNLPGENYAQFVVNTKSNQATLDVLKEYSQKYVDYYPKAVVRFKQMNYQSVKCPTEISFTGDDIEQLRKESDKLVAYLKTQDRDFVWVHTDYEGYQPCAKITLDPVEASRLGINKSVMALNLASNSAGMPLTTLWEGDYAIPVKLKNEVSQGTTNFQSLENQLIPTMMPGVWVPLRQVATVTPDWQPTRIVRKNGVHTLTVSCDLVFGGSYPKSIKKVENYLDNELKPQLPDDVSVSIGGLTSANSEAIPGIVAGLCITIFVIFLFLLYTFKKISISLLGILATLFSLPGAVIGLRIFGIDFGITSILGIVSLIGIIVRNAIIMFEYAEKLRTEQKLGAKEAGFEAGKRRMRPIFLTSAAAAVGVIPMIISKSTLWMPMGVVICFGMIFSLLLVVTVLPVLYWQVYK